MNKAQQLVLQKRAYDYKVNTMQTKLKQEFHQKEFANWQNRGAEIQLKNQVKQNLERARAEAKSQLILRQKKLADLLQYEHQLYSEEIVSNQETPNKIRKKMMDRVHELKNQKEQKRKADAMNRLEKRFQKNADELRKVDLDFKELKTAHERNIQIVEKQNQLKNEYENEMLFAELEKRQIKRKMELQKKKEKQHKEKVRERNAILALQQQMKKRKESQMLSLTQKERQMLKSEWERQSQLEKLKQVKKYENQKKLNQQIAETNQKKIKEQEQINNLQKMRDKQLINRLVQKENEVIQLEKMMKEYEREECRRVLKGVKNRSSQLAEYEKQLDKIIQDEKRKQEKREDQAYERKQRAKLSLLEEIFKDRQQKIQKIRNQKDEIQKTKKIDRQEADKKVKQYRSLQDKERKQGFQKSKVEKENFLKQIAEKQERRRKNIQNLVEEERLKEEERLEYEKKVEERKIVGKKDLQAFKTANRLY